MSSSTSRMSFFSSLPIGCSTNVQVFICTFTSAISKSCLNKLATVCTSWLGLVGLLETYLTVVINSEVLIKLLNVTQRCCSLLAACMCQPGRVRSVLQWPPSEPGHHNLAKRAFTWPHSVWKVARPPPLPREPRSPALVGIKALPCHIRGLLWPCTNELTGSYAYIRFSACLDFVLPHPSHQLFKPNLVSTSEALIKPAAACKLVAA